MARKPFLRSFMSLAALGLMVTTITACGSKKEDSMGYSTSGRQRNAALTAQTARSANVEQIGSAFFNSVALDENGNLYSWGYPYYNHNTIPVLKEGATRFTSFSSGAYHSLALDDLGNMYGIGENSWGQATPPELKDGGTKFTMVAAGVFQSLALDDAGNMYAWGYDGLAGIHDTPTLKKGGTKFVALESDYYTNNAIDDAGNLYSWGDDTNKGVSEQPELKAGATKFTEVSSSWYVTVALDDLGNMYVWGYDGLNQKNIPAFKKGGTKFTHISAGHISTLALDDAGNVYAIGDAAPQSIPSLGNGGTKFTAISMGVWGAFAEDNKGNLYSWGYNTFGENNIPDIFKTLIPIMPIAMGGYQAYGIHEDSHIEKFDYSPDGWTPYGENFVSIAAGLRHALAIDSSGFVTAWGDNMGGQTNVPVGLTNVKQVAAGLAYSVALRSNGEVVEWGSHSAPRGKLIDMPDGLILSSIASGLTHVLGITPEGKVVGWGSNEHGKATPPAGLTGVIAVAANSSCSAALESTGAITYWGSCSADMTATTSVSGATALAMTETTVIALANGEIKSWGSKNDFDQLLDVPSGSNFAAVTAGTYAAMAVDNDGNVSTWGYNGGYTINLPSTFSGIEPTEGGDCPDCGYPDGSMITDDMLKEAAGFIKEILSEEQMKTFINALGGSYSSTMTPEQIDKLIKAASDAERAAALAIANQSVPTVADAKTAVLPASQSPTTKVGAKITPKQAATMLGLKKATKVSFVVPNAKSATCAVTKTAVTASAAGTCSVQVKYTQKKKAKKTVLFLIIG